MQERLQLLEDKYEELTKRLMDPDVLNDPAELRKTAKAQADMEDVVVAFRRYKKVVQELEDSKAMLQEKLDPEMDEMVKMEIKDLTEQKEKLEEELTILLLPKDPNDDKNVIMEIRGGTGGDEAALFAADLYKMYTRYAEIRGWKTEVMNTNYTDMGGYKEITFMIEGKGAYSRLKFEGGVHRVQRVPETESAGRIHTSAATVVVLPEAEDVEVEIAANDIRIDVFCASGPGGQCVNTTQSAVRITHLPTGVVVSCQDEKSQLRNKEKAMKILRSRVLEKYQEEAQGALSDQRKSMVGSGDRSERIRTYNFPQGRVSDHRINLTVHNLDKVLMGNLDEIIEALITTDQAEKLKNADSQ